MKKWITKHGITVIRLDGIRCNCFAIETENEKWLVDTSALSDRNRIIKQLEMNDIVSLDGIILTHAHINHVASAALFAGEYQCPVYIHDSELHFVQTGDCLTPKASNSLAGFVERMVSQISFLNKYPACRDAKAIPFDEPLIWNEYIRIIETPGHSEGGISILIDDEIAIVGDIMKSGVFQMKPAWANQPGLIQVSWKKLLQEECELFLPSHGKEITREQLEKELNKK